MRGEMGREGDSLVGYAHGIVFSVGGKFDMDGVVGEVVGKVHDGEDPVVVGQVAGEGIGKFTLRRLFDRLLGRLMGQFMQGNMRLGKLLLVKLLGRWLLRLLVRCMLWRTVLRRRWLKGSLLWGRLMLNRLLRRCIRGAFQRILMCPRAHPFGRPLLHCLFFSSDSLWCP